VSTAYIAVGSNLGDKRQHCVAAIATLDRSPKIEVTARAGFYKTAPVGFTDQDWFVNTAVRLATDLAPVELLFRLKQIEQDAGRKKGVRFGPRVLDLDIIFYDDLVLSTDRLDIPHPRMHKRRFVLRPICDINSEILHPTLRLPVRDLLSAIDDPHQDIELLQ